MRGFILFLWCSVASAQLPILPFNPISSSSAFSGPTSISGLYEWWDWTQAGNTNQAVTNWIGKIHGIVLTNSSVSSSPTNTANGVWFSFSGQSLTNKTPILIGSNWTIFVSFVYTNLDPGGAFGMNAPLFADNTAPHCFGSTFQTSPKASPELVTVGTQLSYAAAVPYWLKFTDWTLCNSNNANGTGQTYCWTNGVAAQKSSQVPTFTNFNNVAWDPQYNDGLTYLVGSIRHIMIYTNALLDVNISNLHYWRTNVDLTTP